LNSSAWIPPMLLLSLKATSGQSLWLCDFASAGVGGSPYRSWLEVEGVTATDYSRKNPLRTGRPKGS